MALSYNSFLIGQGQGFKITGNLPIDIRQVVNSIADLSKGETWAETPPYKGLLVATVSEGAVYMCKDFQGTTENSWIKVSGSGDVDLTEVYRQINEVSTYVSNVSIDVSNLRFTVSNISTFVSNVSTRVDSLEMKIVNVSNAIDNVSLRLS